MSFQHLVIGEPFSHVESITLCGARINGAYTHIAIDLMWHDPTISIGCPACAIAKQIALANNIRYDSRERLFELLK